MADKNDVAFQRYINVSISLRFL